MAKNGDVLAQMLSCVVCLEDYDQDGNYIPRLLPEGGTDYNTMKNNSETVKRIIENNRESLSGARSFQFPVFRVGRYSREIFGSVTTGEISLFLPDHEHPQKCSPYPDPDTQRTLETFPPQQNPVVSGLKYTGTYTLLCSFIYSKNYSVSFVTKILMLQVNQLKTQLN